MKKVKSFFILLKRSVIPHYPFYHTIPKLNVLHSFFYFLSLLLLLNAVFLFLMVLQVRPMKVQSHLSKVASELTLFPQDLTIIMKNGMLITTYDKPYFFWLNDNGNKKLLFVIDKNVSKTELSNYNAPFIVNSQTFFFKKDPVGKTYHSIPLQTFGDQIISKQTILESATVIQTIAHYFLPIFIVSLIFVYFGMFAISFLVMLLYLLAATGVVYLYFFIRHRNHPYPFKTIFHIGLYALTLPLILDYTLSLFHFASNFTPFLFMILYCVFVWGGVHEAYYKKHTR